MKITAIIAEYNPYHNGHDFQKKLIKHGQKSHYTVAIMSGNFTQRGEAALFDKWTRARMALLAGIDIVIELPAVYALQSAEGFASGGVAIANSLEVIDELCFGSESADEQGLRNAAHLLVTEDQSYRRHLKEYLLKGLSFPSARMQALQAAAGLDANIINQPNDILAIEYLKALERSGSSIFPRIIKRAGAGYHDTDISGSLASASAIRTAILQNDFEGVYRNIPEECGAVLRKVLSENKPVSTEDFFRLILYRLRTMKAWQIAEISGVQEGLEYRMEKTAAEADSLETLITGIKSKRYTQTRISRILMCCLLYITQEKIQEANTYEGLYARILGYRKDALPALSLLSKKSRIPVVTSGTQLPQNIVSKTDILASDVYALACADLKAGRDYTEKLIIV